MNLVSIRLGPRGLSFTSWLFSWRERQPHIAPQTTCAVPATVPPRWLSSSGTSFVCQQHLVRVVANSGPGPAMSLKYALPFTESDIIAVLFSTTDEHDIMVILHYNRYRSTVALTVFDANAESILSRRRSLRVANMQRQQQWPFNLIPVPGNPSNFALLVYSSDAFPGAFVTMLQFRVTRDNVELIMRGTTQINRRPLSLHEAIQ